MKKETLKDFVKGWSIKDIVDAIGSAGIEFMANHATKYFHEAGLEEYKAIKRIMITELNRRIRNAKKL